MHGRPWLRVADASLFPDALEINPYLTIMALADRLAQTTDPAEQRRLKEDLARMTFGD